MGELIQLFPSANIKRSWSGITRTYGLIILEPFEAMINIDEFILTLVEESSDGKCIDDTCFYDQCKKFNLSCDTSFEIHEALSSNGIFKFSKEG